MTDSFWYLAKTTKFCKVIIQIKSKFYKITKYILLLWKNLKSTNIIFFSDRILFYLFIFYFTFKLYIIVLVLPNIKMNLPQVYMCSPSWTLLPPPSPYHPSGSVCSYLYIGLAKKFIWVFIHCYGKTQTFWPTPYLSFFFFRSILYF